MASGIEFSLTGLQDLRARLLLLALDGRAADAERAITEEWEVEGAASQEIVPVLTGRLKRSMRVIPAVMTTGAGVVDFVTRIVYGGPDVPYAVVQHFAFKYHHDDGQAQYLESVIRESRRFMGQRLARRIRGLFV